MSGGGTLREVRFHPLPSQRAQLPGPPQGSHSRLRTRRVDSPLHMNSSGAHGRGQCDVTVPTAVCSATRGRTDHHSLCPSSVTVKTLRITGDSNSLGAAQPGILQVIIHNRYHSINDWNKAVQLSHILSTMCQILYMYMYTSLSSILQYKLEGRYFDFL